MILVDVLLSLDPYHLFSNITLPYVCGDDITVLDGWAENVNDVVRLYRRESGGVQGEHLHDVVLLEHRVLGDQVDWAGEALVPYQYLGTRYPDNKTTLK